MKIFLFIDTLGSGGAQRQVVNMYEQLSKAGHTVEIVIYHYHLFYKSDLDRLQAKIVCIENKSPIKRMLLIRKYFRKEKPDMIISYLDSPNFIACFSSVGAHPWKLIINERSADKYKFKNYKHRIMKEFSAFADKIVCNSKNAAAIWGKYFVKFEDKIAVIYNIYDIKNNHMKRKDTKPGRIHMIVLASYQKNKNPHLLIEAVKKLGVNKNKLLIEWYGRQDVDVYDGRRVYEDCVRMINEEQLGDVIHLHGEKENVYPLISNADILGLFSNYEGLPNAVCEAMLLGKPIMMTRVSDYDILVDQTNGILCDPTIDSIFEGLMHLLSLSPESLEAMGNESLDKAKNLFSLETVMSKWYNLFASLK